MSEKNTQENPKLETVELQESDLENVSGGEDIDSRYDVDDSEGNIWSA